jgi:hypothetical protein
VAQIFYKKVKNEKIISKTFSPRNTEFFQSRNKRSRLFSRE